VVPVVFFETEVCGMTGVVTGAAGHMPTQLALFALEEAAKLEILLVEMKLRS
jgi:hypothetical protein